MFGLKDLRERRLRVSRINDLNDPFEFIGIEKVSCSVKNSVQMQKDVVANQFGVCCFSENWKNPVQWAHYADKHKGICLGFDITSDELKKVEYVSELLKLEDFSGGSTIRRLCRTKYKHWEYEEEHRVFVELKEEEDGHYYLNFESNMVLKEIIIGCNSSLCLDDFKSVLNNIDEVQLFKSKPSPSVFEMLKETLS